ncbi:MAG TPA: serine/threonine-protein kinase, partial [Candidatus Xenobia bacterium]
ERGAILEELQKSEIQDNRLGQVIGPYRLARRLGSGGMATVYAAFPNDVFGDPDKQNQNMVALKLVLQEVAKEEDFRRRFMREVEISRRLDHPNIVHTIDWGEHLGELYLAMELVDGDTLRALVGGKMVPPMEAMSYLVPLFEAVDYAHRQGVVHRDLKPDNVMVSRLRTLKVMDFGLAKRHDVSRLTRITKTGTALGTPGYMAPEQIMGKENLGPQVDQYALGVMAYEFLTGGLPYHAEDPIALMFKQCSDPPPSLRQFEPRLAKALDRAVLKMLSIEPVDRYPDVLSGLQAMQEALGMQLSGVHKIHDWQTLGMRRSGGEHD